MKFKQKAENEIMNQEIPVVFLDIDGVLHSFCYEKYLIRNNKEWFDENGAIFDPKCVNEFNKLISVTKAKIVISSSWKDNDIGKDTISVFNKIWHDRGLNGEIAGVTPTLSSDDLHNLYGIQFTRKWKGYEIDLWLKNNGQCRSYVIIDDQEVVLKKQKKYFVKTNGNKGLQAADVKKALDIIITQQTKDRKSNGLMTLFRQLLKFTGTNSCLFDNLHLE